MNKVESKPRGKEVNSRYKIEGVPRGMQENSKDAANKNKGACTSNQILDDGKVLRCDRTLFESAPLQNYQRVLGPRRTRLEFREERNFEFQIAP